MSSLSSLDRSTLVQQLQTETFDLLVVGGGITGAGIALDAVTRGMKVALVEKHDFASGTSSKSTKLIHGGLRYLKQFEMALVREVGRERAIVHQLAPHLVSAEKMLLPLMEGGTFGKVGTSMGLWVYDLLAGVQGNDKRRMLDKAETLEKEPLLSQQSDLLKGSGYYAEYRTDDARLTIENIKAAAKRGAACLNYLKVEDFSYDANGKVTGANCTDTNSGEAFNVKAKYIISAAGPWVDSLRKKDRSLKGKRLFLSKGVHIVLPHKRFPVRQSLYFDVADGRMIFAIPRHRATYIGTTDTPYEGDLNRIPIHQEDVDYLLDAVNQMFPGLELKKEDVESSWAGLRPLIHEEGKSASAMSRKDEIFESESGLISIAGGKLTGYRKMAERVVNLVANQFGEQQKQRFGGNQTKSTPLSGGPFKNGQEVAEYQRSIQSKIQAHQLPEYYSAYLVANYGRQANTILEQMNAYEGHPEIALARAELWFTIHHELCLRPMDFFNRRTGRLYFNLPSIERVLDPVLDDFAAYLGWEPHERADAEAEVKRELYEACHFEPAQGVEKAH